MLSARSKARAVRRITGTVSRGLWVREGAPRTNHRFSGSLRICSPRRILPFLDDANRANERTVVHCSAGMGRTGHILALWLVHGRDYSLDKAIKTVEQQGRTPLEIATRDELKYRLK